MKNINLLLVDDEADFRKTIAKRITKRGITPMQAGSGEECLDILAKNRMDVVLLDVKMPGMNGLNVLQKIKNNYKDTEVILLTGHAATDDGVEGIKAGAFDYLGKPIEFEQLYSKINQAFETVQRRHEKAKENEFREKIEQQMIATERLASLGTLATGVAHEINNPLAIINESAGWMKLLLGKDELADMPRKTDFELAIGKIEKSIDRAKKITHQLLSFVKKNDSTVSEVNLVELIDESIELVHREAENHNIKIIKKFNTKRETIHSDPYQLRQVLINLLTNALQAAGDKGEVGIILDCDENDASITVKNTGEGIPEENLKKIFEPFFSTKSPGKGTGLGLFITRGIIDKLGGTIEVASKLGHETSFCIKLPAYYVAEDKIGKDKRMSLLDKIKGDKSE